MPSSPSPGVAAPARTHAYRRRTPERSVLYRLVQSHLATWIGLREEGDAVPAHVERELRRYLECGMLAHGFARAYCEACDHDFLVALSCKGRGICPSCTAKRMSLIAAHLTCSVIPPVPVRQEVLSIPKRLRYFLAHDGEFLNKTVSVMVNAIEQCLRRHTPGAAAGARLGAVVFIQRFGALLNAHTHLHVIVLDGLCEPDGAGGVRFQGDWGLEGEVVAEVQQRIRTQLLRHARARGFLDPHEAQQMLAWTHGGGFSLNASVQIPAHDREGLERLIRYCARPAFALERLRQIGPDRYRYDAPKPGPQGNVSLIASPLELLDRLAALIPPPRTHRHLYFGCLAPNAPLRPPIALWAQACNAPPPGQPHAEAHHFTPAGTTLGAPASGMPSPAQPSPTPRTPAQWRWATLLARVFECLPLLCLQCAAPMRIIAFITDPSPVTAILSHLNLSATAPPVSPARGPPQPHDTPRAPTPRNNPHPPWDPNAQPAPDFQFDQRLSW